MGQTVEISIDSQGGILLPPELVDKQGIIFVRAETSEDLANITRRMRDSRVADMLQRAGG